MNPGQIKYLGPIPGEAVTPDEGLVGVFKRVPISLIVVVILPTLIAAIYIFFIASPLYVSEAKFVVRAQSREAPSALGLALQGVGISNSQTDAFAVHEYMRSRSAVAELDRASDLRTVLSRPGADFLSRYPRAWEGRSEEDLYAGFRRFLTVGYDSTNGISTLRVEAFTPQDAQMMTRRLLSGGEALVNQLNQRSNAEAVVEAQRGVAEAADRLSLAQTRLTEFRNRERFIDPVRSATEGSVLIGGLLQTLAELRAERAQIASQAPQSPQLSAIDSRIAAFESQIASERAGLAGSASSLAPKIGNYESLVLDRELADRAVIAATASLDDARIEARRQQLYLEQIVPPNLPDKATQPKRLFNFLTVLSCLMLAYGIGWLVVAGIREHRAG